MTTNGRRVRQNGNFMATESFAAIMKRIALEHMNKSPAPIQTMSRAELENKIEREKIALWKSVQHQMSRAASPLMAVMTRDLNTTSPATSNVGLQLLKKAMA
jgi:hypothetical protein